MPKLTSHSPVLTPDPRLDRALRVVVLSGMALVLAIPSARQSNLWVGALPLWLLAMPLVSWWALHRFRLPLWRTPSSLLPRRRRSAAQARRRTASRFPARLPRAA